MREPECIIGSGAVVCSDERKIEVEVAHREVMGSRIRVPFLESTGVEDAQDLACNLIRDVWDKLKGVVEGADDEAVVTGEGVG